MIVPAAAPVIIPECRHTGVAVPRVCGAPRPIGWLPPLTPGLLAKPQPLPLPSFPPLAPPRGARLPMPARRAPESPCVHTWDPHSPHLEQRSSHGNDNTRQFPVCGHPATVGPRCRTVYPSPPEHPDHRIAPLCRADSQPRHPGYGPVPPSQPRPPPPLPWRQPCAERAPLRRAAAKEVAEEVGAGRVALGHTLDDEVENLLYRVGRYGGRDVLAGMGTLSGISVGPLLGVRRRETAGYCRFHGLTFAREVGNEDPKYARTGIRERVLPAWEDALPGAVQAAGRTAEVAAEASRVVQGLVEEAIQWVAVPRVRGAPRPRYGGTLELSPVRLLGLSSPIRRAVLHKMLEESRRLRQRGSWCWE